MKLKAFFAVIAFMAFFGYQKADACTRVLYTGDTTATESANVLRIVGRSLDWSTPIPTNLYVYPRGMKKKSNNKAPIIEWTSKYGSVYAVGYDGGVTEGMNEKGLCLNGLFCRNTVYNGPQQEDKPYMSLAVITAWILDNCATTSEAIDLVKNQDFQITGATFDGGTISTLHWGITDSEGYSAVFEFTDGKLNIFQGEGENMPVLTNEPTFPQMEAINAYWNKIGGQNFLPGSVGSADRFVRGSYFVNSVERTNDLNTGLAIIRSILNDCSVPFKYERGDKNLSQTQWRSFANIRDKTYYFENVNDLGLYYIDLKKCDLRPGAPVLFFNTADAIDVVGDITSKLVPSKPFTPMY